jgi:hypothetical protein
MLIKNKKKENFMNIFYLDENVKTCAEYHCDKHVVKMIVESTQILSTVLRSFDYDYEFLYKSTHVNHPCVIWTRHSYKNFTFLLDLALMLCIEYTKRYGKTHSCEEIIYRIAIECFDDSFKLNFKEQAFTEPAQCMPIQYRIDGNPIQAYRNYYINEKSSFAKWKLNNIPYWFKTEKMNVNIS